VRKRVGRPHGHIGVITFGMRSIRMINSSFPHPLLNDNVRNGPLDFYGVCECFGTRYQFFETLLCIRKVFHGTPESSFK